MIWTMELDSKRYATFVMENSLLLFVVGVLTTALMPRFKNSTVATTQYRVLFGRNHLPT
jgi:hypothetical protein